MSRRWSRTRTARSSGRTKPVFAQHWRKWWKIRTCEPILVLRTGAPPANGSTNLPWSAHMKTSMLGRLEAMGRSAVAGSAAIDNGVQFPLTRAAKGAGSRSRIGGERERSEEHTSELQSLMRISYAVFCLKKKRENKSMRIRRL